MSEVSRLRELVRRLAIVYLAFGFLNIAAGAARLGEILLNTLNRRNG